MKSKMESKDIITGIIGIAVALVVAIWLGSSILNKPKKDEKVEAQGSAKSSANTDKSANPIAVSYDQMRSLSGQEFAEKYRGKLVVFDAVIFSTLKDHEAGMATTLYPGDDPNGLGFTDGAMIKVMSPKKSTFSPDLAGYARLSEGTPTTFPKVRAVLSPVRYDKEKNTVYMSDLSNDDGKNPSISSIN